MSNWVPTLSFALFLLVSSGEGQVAKRSPATPRLIAGEYVRNDYLDGLEETHSPSKSLAFGTPQLVIARLEKTGLTLITIFNFHDGGAEFLLHPDGTVGTLVDAGFVTANLSFKIIDSHHLVLGFDKFLSQTYTFVGDIAQYSREVLLAGEYLDQKGRHYIFGHDGTATFPDRTFQYSVGTDQVLNRFDYFQDDTQKEVFGFRKSGNTLEIFHTSGEINQHVDKTPFLSLRMRAK